MKIWAHRGASAYAPQNTLEAFRLAAELGADGIELDVHLTVDGEIVVCHNETIDATSNGTGEIHDMTLAELKQYDFGCKFPGFAGKGVTIPTLREVYACVAPTGMIVNCELKTNVHEYPGIEEKCIALSHEMGMYERVLYSSFNFDSLQRVLAIDPTIRTGLLYEGPVDDALGLALGKKAWALHPYYPRTYEDDLAAFAARGVQVNPWTVDDPEEIRRQMDMGIHAVITDAPDVARRVRDEGDKH